MSSSVSAQCTGSARKAGFLNIQDGLEIVLKSDLGRNLLYSTAVLNGAYAQACSFTGRFRKKFSNVHSMHRLRRVS